MDFPAVANMTVQSAVKLLQAKRQPDMDEVIRRLNSARFTTSCAAILAEISPEKYYAACRGGMLLITDGNLMTPLAQAAIEAIMEVAPLDEEALEVIVSEGEYPMNLPPASAGFPMSFDEWDEFRCDIDNCSEDMSLYVFYTALRFGDHDVLDEAACHFNWEINSRFSEGDLDWDKMYAMLERETWSKCFVNAIDIICYQTGNIYFDYNPYDADIIYDLPPFTIDGFHTLETEWQEAKPILLDYELAKDLFLRDPEVPGELLEMWKACITPSRTRTNLTLAEVWREDEEEEEEMDGNVE